MRILGVSGSPRRKGNSDLILDRILSGTGLETQTLYLSDMDYSSCVGCEKCRTDRICTQFDDDLTPFYEAVVKSQGLVVVSPVYNYNITAWVKAFIDRLYCFYEFDDERPRGWSSRLAGQGRKAALAVVAEQVDEKDLGIAMQALRMPIKALGYDLQGEMKVMGKFEAGIVGRDQTVLEQAGGLGRKLAAALENQNREGGIGKVE